MAVPIEFPNVNGRGDLSTRSFHSLAQDDKFRGIVFRLSFRILMGNKRACRDGRLERRECVVRGLVVLTESADNAIVDS